MPGSRTSAITALALAALGIAIVRALEFAGFRGFPIYFLVGALIWLAVDASGIHATVTGVILGLITPARRWVSDERLYAILSQVIAHPSAEEGSGDTRDRKTLQIAEIAARETLSPAERLEVAVEVRGKQLLAVHAADARPAALDVHHFHFFM